MWSKWQWVMRIASTSTPSERTASSRRSASSPGSTMTARSAPLWARTMYEFSCTGPTVKERTSGALIADAPREHRRARARRGRRSSRRGLSATAARLAALTAVVHPQVGVVADRRVHDEDDREQPDCLVGFVEEDDHGEQEQDRGEHRPEERPAPRRRAVALVQELLLLARALGLSAAGLLGLRGLASRASPRLDDAGGVAAVLGLSLALGRGHDYQPNAFSSRWRAGSKPGMATSCGNPLSAARGASPTSSAEATSWCLAIAAMTAASGTSSGRSMFIETCATGPLRAIPIARTPGRPSRPPSRISAATARASATLAGPASCTLNATSGSRAPRSVAPAVGCSRGGPKSGRSRPSAIRSARPRTPPRRSSARVRCEPGSDPLSSP